MGKRRQWKKYYREIASIGKEMALEQKLFHRSICYEEAMMHQERYSLLRQKLDEIRWKQMLSDDLTAFVV